MCNGRRGALVDIGDAGGNPDLPAPAATGCGWVGRRRSGSGLIAQRLLRLLLVQPLLIFAQGSALLAVPAVWRDPVHLVDAGEHLAAVHRSHRVDLWLQLPDVQSAGDSLLSLTGPPLRLALAKTAREQHVYFFQGHTYFLSNSGKMVSVAVP